MDHLSTLDLHRLRYGELSGARESRVRGHVGDCSDCRRRLGELDTFRREFELSGVPQALRRKTPPWADRWWAVGWRPAAFAAAAALGAIIVVGPLTMGPAETVFEEAAPEETASEMNDALWGTRTKGVSTAAVEILVEGRGLIGEGDTLHPGDRVQIRVSPGDWGYAWVTSGDTILGGFAVEPDKATLAPFSLTLDEDASDDELAVLLTRDHLPPTQVHALSRAVVEIPGDVAVVELDLPRSP